MSMKVIGAGPGRTGTASLKVALEKLGVGPCYHMGEVLPRVDEFVPLWIEAGRGNPDWDAIFKGYQSSCDYPSSNFWKEQMAHYPDAKVILTTRSAESWFDSVNTTILSKSMNEWIESGPLREFFELCVWKDYKAHIYDRDWMIEYFNRREAQIIDEVPSEKLLVYSVKEGWEPLCRFLEVDIPEVDFPRVNSRDETRRILDAMIGSTEQNLSDLEKDMSDVSGDVEWMGDKE